MLQHCLLLYSFLLLKVDYRDSRLTEGKPALACHKPSCLLLFCKWVSHLRPLSGGNCYISWVQRYENYWKLGRYCTGNLLCHTENTDNTEMNFGRYISSSQSEGTKVMATAQMPLTSTTTQRHFLIRRMMPVQPANSPSVMRTAWPGLLKKAALYSR